MPGVPSGKGCDACRKQKKKCDQGKPSCARCTRLRIECVGSGQRRYKFKEPTQFRASSDASSSGAATPNGLEVVNASTPSDRSGIVTPLYSPSNEHSALLRAFNQAIAPSTDRRYNLIFSYGSFLRYIPSRLGLNPALDASVAAMTEAHANFCSRSGVTASALAKYSDALTQLRLILDDGAKACATETLCATMLLSISQSLLGTELRNSMTHTTGMARILKYRGRPFNPEDPFESELLLTLRGPVVFEALWNEDIEFSDTEWHELVTNHLDNDGRPHAKLMLCLSRLPNLLRRRRRWDAGDIHEAIVNYQMMQLARADIWLRLSYVQQKLLDGDADKETWQQAEFDLVRVLSLTLGIIIITGCMLRSLRPPIFGVSNELHVCAEEILNLAQFAVKYRPLGASIMPMALALACLATEDGELRSTSYALMNEYMQDYPGATVNGGMDSCIKALEKRCKLLDCPITTPA